MKDIAVACGVSTPTVSLILNRKGDRYSQSTQALVTRIANEMGYSPDINARSLQKGKSFLIGVLYSGVNYQYANEFNRGMQKVTIAKNYAPIVFTHTSLEEEKVYLQCCLDRRIDGLILNLAVDDRGRTNAGIYKKLRAKGMPIVEIFGDFSPDMPSVSIDFFQVGLISTRKLLAQGHRRIVMFTHNRYQEQATISGLYHNAWDLWMGYLKAMEEAGLEPKVITHHLPINLNDERAIFDSAYAGADEALDAQAVICLDTVHAEALRLRVINEAKPSTNRLSIITLGMDHKTVNSPFYDLYMVPAPFRQIGESAAEAVFQQILGKVVEDKKIGPIDI